MPTVTFMDHNGAAHTVQAHSNESLMAAAIAHGVPGIDADCGGACACGTCHVFIDPSWLQALEPAQPMEAQMLSSRPDSDATSRLCCQLTVSDALDGLVVRIPQFQM